MHQQSHGGVAKIGEPLSKLFKHLQRQTERRGCSRYRNRHGIIFVFAVWGWDQVLKKRRMLWAVLWFFFCCCFFLGLSFIGSSVKSVRGQPVRQDSAGAFGICSYQQERSALQSLQGGGGRVWSWGREAWRDERERGGLIKAGFCNSASLTASPPPWTLHLSSVWWPMCRSSEGRQVGPKMKRVDFDFYSQ